MTPAIGATRTVTTEKNGVTTTETLPAPEVSQGDDGSTVIKIGGNVHKKSPEVVDEKQVTSNFLDKIGKDRDFQIAAGVIGVVLCIILSILGYRYYRSR